MSQDQIWTIGRLLNWTTQYLKEHGADSPRLDAEVLLAHSCGCERIELYTTFEEDPGEAVRTAFRQFVRRRAEGAPVAYLVGKREFYSLSFRVTPDVLIPRPETEFLVIALLDLAKKHGGDRIDIADLGCGSGILAVCFAKHLPACHVTAIDVSEAALQVARANARDHGVEDRITFIESDLFAEAPPELRFDFVVSNPPYITDDEMKKLSPTVRDHEPHLALEGGETGTKVIEPLIIQTAKRLSPGGYLLCEISPMLSETVRELLQADISWNDVTFHKDLAGLIRVVQARQKS